MNGTTVKILSITTPPSRCFYPPIVFTVEPNE